MANSATRSGTALSNGPSLQTAPTIKRSAYAANTCAASLTGRPQQPQDTGYRGQDTGHRTLEPTMSGVLYPVSCTRCPVSSFSKGTDSMCGGRGLLFAGGGIGRRRGRHHDENSTQRSKINRRRDLDLLIERVVDVG